MCGVFVLGFVFLGVWWLIAVVLVYGDGILALVGGLLFRCFAGVISVCLCGLLHGFSCVV